MAEEMGCSLTDLMQHAEMRAKIDIHRYVTEQVGIPTLNDILGELAKPGRDPRKGFESFAFADDIEKISDLKIGMKVPGIVTNVTAFGAFVDIGVHQDGLVHPLGLLLFQAARGDAASIAKPPLATIGKRPGRSRPGFDS